MERDEIKNEVTDDCSWCHKRGGKKMIDPYRADVHDERVLVRLHENCADELRGEI